MYPSSKPVDVDALLAEVYAAELLGLSSRTLQAWRTKGVGPAFVRAGRAIRYRRRDLLIWIDANTVSSAGARGDVAHPGRVG
jgi:Helix-turn-helix domain